MPTQEKAEINPPNAEAPTPSGFSRRLDGDPVPRLQDEARTWVPNDLILQLSGALTEPVASNYGEEPKEFRVRGERAW